MAPRVAATGDLHASTGSATINNCHFIIRLAEVHHPATDTTESLSLLLQSLAGPVVAYPLFPPAFLPACHMTYTRCSTLVNVHTCLMAGSLKVF
jgi:hypothetical protein